LSIQHVGLLCPIFTEYDTRSVKGVHAMPQKPSPALTVRDVAAYLNVDEKTIYRLAQRGELPGFKVAGAWRFQSADLQRWIDQRKRLSAKQKGKDVRGKR